MKNLLLVLILGLIFSTQLSFVAAATESEKEARYLKARENMVLMQLINRGIKDERVLSAMRKVKRHRFVPEKLKSFAYMDRPLPIGEEQTISQPYIVALMTELPATFLLPIDSILRVFTISIVVGVVGMYFILIRLSRQSIMDIFRQTF